MGKGCDFFSKNGKGRFSVAAIIAMVIGGLALAVLFAFLFGWLVMVLWNWLMPEIFGLPVITYWQGWGLVLLSHILVKGGWGSHGGSDSKKGHKDSCGSGADDCSGGESDSNPWTYIKKEIAKEIRKEMEKDTVKENTKPADQMPPENI